MTNHALNVELLQSYRILNARFVVLSQQAMQSPWQHSLFGLLRSYNAIHANLPLLSESFTPKDEHIRLGQYPALIFAPREIAQIYHHYDKCHIQVYGLGMLGPNGSLPIHITEMAKERLENRKDATLVNFLNIFHHRYLSHFYRAWSQSQSTVGLDRADDERFSRYIAWLTGNDPQEIRQTRLSAHARLSCAAHLVRESKNPEGLIKILSSFFGVKVVIQENELYWMDIDSADITTLGKPALSSILGQGAVLGEKVPDRQSKFRLIIGPLTIEQYLRFTPQGEDLPVLVDWVRAFIGFEYVWDVELKVESHSAPSTTLSGAQKLGWSTWLGNNPTPNDISGMIFEPEQYFNERSVG